MRLPIPTCLLFSGVLLAALPANAAAHGENETAVRLLTREQGLTVVRAASAHRREITNKPDCSHLVHQIYEFAGFPYPYASSLDLYDGVESFRRVNVPHAGDLIVWRGHVGVVTDPKQHGFFSSVRSGLRTEYYDQPYWRARGRPRFYRYLLGSDRPVLAADTSRMLKVPQPQSQAETAPAGRATTDSSKPETLASAASESEPVTSPPTPSPQANRSLEPPSSLLVATTGNRPTADEVEGAISELNSAAGVALRNGTPANAARPLLIYDQLKVERLDINRDHGSARVEIDGHVSIAGEKLERKRRHDKARWELRRTAQGWQLLAPLDRVYVPRDVAVRVLATRLALLTEKEAASDDSDPSIRQEARIVQTLNFLFDQH
jgi:hypothetical protein